MKQKIFKILLLALVVVGALLFVAEQDNTPPVLVDEKKTSTPVEAKNLVQVHFLDVGQGDAIYIRMPDEQDVLIDGGPDKSVLNELGKVMPFWDREIDIMILTHPHSDHVSGLVEVLRRFKVKQIYYTGVLHTAPDYLAWLEEIKKQNLKLNIVTGYFELNFGGGIKLEFLYPQKSLVNRKFKELNDSSIVTKLVDDKVSFLFTGDAGESVEKELLRSSPASSATVIPTGVEGSVAGVDVLKVGHHGSGTSSSEKFLQAVKPKYAIISVGKDNEFGHPHLKILKRLERFGAQIFRTDERGTICFVTDGESLSVE